MHTRDKQELQSKFLPEARTIKKSMFKIGGIWLQLLIATSVMISGCSSSSSDKAMSVNSVAETAIQEEKSSSEAPRELQKAADHLAAGEASRVTTGGVAAVPTQQDRKLIYRGNLVMEVQDYEAAKQRVNDIVHLSGGYTLEFQDQFSDYERGGRFIFKIPSSGFQSTLDQLNRIEHLRFERSYSANDVTEEYVDLESRLQARRVTESRLLAYMEKADNTDDLLQLSNQLADEQELIEQIAGRMRYLDNNVEMSSIELRLYETIKDNRLVNLEGNFGETIARTLNGSIDALLGIGRAIIIMITALVPFLIVFAIIVIPLWMVIRRTRRVRKERAEYNRHAAYNSEMLVKQSLERQSHDSESDPESSTER